MANANWTNPQLTSTYTNFVTEVKARDEDLAKQFDGFTGSNQVTGTIRWDSSANRWKKWTGSAWGELTATYALTALTTTGTAAFGGNTTVTGTLDVSSTITGTAFIPDGTTAPANGIYLQSANVLGLAAGSAGRVFIKSSTGVGIGETNPGKKLDVAGGIRVAAGNDFDGDVGYTFRSGGDMDGGLFSNADGKLILATNNAARLTINGSNIGIGTESPGQNLHINVSGGGGAGIRLQNNEGIANLIADGDNLFYDADGHIFRNQAGSSIVKIDTANTRLGIGTTSPTDTLHVNGTAKATTFSGSGASLTSIPAGQLTGTIDSARLPASSGSNTTGNAATATKLQTARTIGGVSFDGTANINLAGVNTAGNQNTSGSSASCTGNAATATDLAINATNRLVIQNSNNATDVIAQGSSGQFLKSNGSSAPSWSTVSAEAKFHIITSNTTFTPTAGKSSWLVYATGGGGSSGSGNSNYDDTARVGRSGQGGSGGTGIRFYNATEMGSNASVTIGSGGSAPSWANNGNAGGATSFNPSGTGTTVQGLGGSGSPYANEWTGSGAGGAAGATNGGQLGFNGTKGINGNSSGYTETNRAYWTANSYGQGGAGKQHGSHTSGNAGLHGAVVIFEW